MGRAQHPLPEKLPAKLFYIRLHLALTQEEMVERLQSEIKAAYQEVPSLFSGQISEYERGEREPPLIVLLHYARLAQIPVEVLIDDGMSLPGIYTRYILLNIKTLSERKRMKL